MPHRWCVQICGLHRVAVESLLLLLTIQLHLQVWVVASALGPQFAAIDHLVAQNLRRVQVTFYVCLQVDGKREH